MARETIFFRTEGDVELRRKLMRAPPRVVARVLGPALRAGLRVIHAQGKVNARRSGGTGTLARALVVARDRKASRAAPAYSLYTRRGKSYQIGNRQGRTGSKRKANRTSMDGFYGPMVELGTKAHNIPRGSAADARRKVVMTFGGRSGQVFARKVQHPGAKPSPYLAPAFYSKRVEALLRVRQYAAQRIDVEVARA